MAGFLWELFCLCTVSVSPLTLGPRPEVWGCAGFSSWDLCRAHSAHWYSCHHFSLVHGTERRAWLHISLVSLFSFCDSFWWIFQVSTFGEDTGSSAGKESAYNEGDPGLIPGLGRAPGEGIGYPLQYSWASLGAQMVKTLPAVWETWLWSLGWEDALEEGVVWQPTPVFLPGESPWTEEPGRLSRGCKESKHITPWLSFLLPHLCTRQCLPLVSACCSWGRGQGTWDHHLPGQFLWYGIRSVSFMKSGSHLPPFCLFLQADGTGWSFSVSDPLPFVWVSCSMQTSWELPRSSGVIFPI